jgi:uncharacterized protein DUF6444
MYQDELAKLTSDELIALALVQAAQIETQAAQITELAGRVAELEAKLGQPPKTPDNSSVPPSQGRKANRAERRAAKKRKGRPGVFRALADNPDRIVESLAECCPHCAHQLSPADQPEFHAGACPRAGRRPDPGDHIELPPPAFAGLRRGRLFVRSSPETVSARYNHMRKNFSAIAGHEVTVA